MPLYPSKVLRAKAPIPYSSSVFSLDSHLSPSRSWEHVRECVMLFEAIGCWLVLFWTYCDYFGKCML
jgi:hypothetical protein